MFLAGIHTLLIQLGWLTSVPPRPPGSHSLCISVTGIKSICDHFQLFALMLEIGLRSSYLWSKQKKKKNLLCHVSILLWDSYGHLYHTRLYKSLNLADFDESPSQLWIIFYQAWKQANNAYLYSLSQHLAAFAICILNVLTLSRYSLTVMSISVSSRLIGFWDIFAVQSEVF